MKPLIQLYKQIAGDTGWTMAGIAGISSLTVFSSTGLMFCSAYILSFSARHPSVAEILVAVTAVRFFGLSRAVCRYFERMTAHDTVFRLLSHLRGWIYRQVSAVSGKKLLTMNRSEAFNALTLDIDNLQDFFLRTYLPLTVTLVIGGVVTGIIALEQVNHAVGFAVIYLVGSVGAAWLIHHNTKGDHRQLREGAQHYKTAFSTYAEGMSDLIANRRVAAFEKNLGRADRELAAHQLHIARWHAIGSAFQQLIIHGTVFAALLIGAVQVQTGRLSGIYLAGAGLVFFTVYEASPQLLTLFQKIEFSGGSASRIMAYRQDSRADDSREQTGTLQTFTGDESTHHTVVLKNVDFTYGNDQTLKQVSVTLEQGKRVAVVGASGSGKSTLAGVLSGLLPVDGGERYWNGRLIPPDAHETLLPLFSVIDQQVYLFNMTLRQNLQLGKPTATEEELCAVLHLAGYTPTGQENWETFLGREIGLFGASLSGGQRQRVAIARALLRKAPFLIIDEGLAGLSREKEAEVLKTLLAQEKSRGILFVTHRLIEMTAMDHILVMDAGAIVEQGTHFALLEQNGLYARMVALQSDEMD